MESKESSICPRCVEAAANAEKCIREHPKESAIATMCAGFLIAQLPLRLLAAGLVRLFLLVLKPAAIIYGLYCMAEDCPCRHHHQDRMPDAGS